MAGYRTPFASEEVTKSEGKERNGCSKQCFVNKDTSNEPQRSSTLPNNAPDNTLLVIYLMHKLLYLTLGFGTWKEESLDRTAEAGDYNCYLIVEAHLALHFF